jgi:hypothetical protein
MDVLTCSPGETESHQLCAYTWTHAFTHIGGCEETEQGPDKSLDGPDPLPVISADAGVLCLSVGLPLSRVRVLDFQGLSPALFFPPQDFC